MADEIQSTGNEGTNVPGEAKPLSRIQEEAISQGWVPKDEFQGDEDEFIDAAEFVRRGELFRKIESQSKELKDVKKALAGLAQHNAKIREVEYNRALEALKSQKKEALSEGDADRVVDIDEKIDLVKDQQKQLHSQQQVQEVPEVHPELQSWMGRNGWYEMNPSMRGWADGRGVELAKAGKSPTEVLAALEKEVKDVFKTQFRNPNRDRPGAVEGAANRQGKSVEAEMELSDVEKTIMKTLVDGGHITKDEYLKQLKAVKSK